MSRTGQVVHVRGLGGAISGARAVADDGGPVGSGASWTQTFVGEVYAHAWDIADEGYFDGVDEMVVPASGVYWVAAHPALWGGDIDMTSGYVEASIKKNGVTVASRVVSYQQSVSSGFVDEWALSWVGASDAGDSFALVIHNATNLNDYGSGYEGAYLCVLRIA